MMLRRAGLGLLVGAILVAPSVASSAPALVFEPYNGTVLYAEDPDAQWFPASLTKLMTADAGLILHRRQPIGRNSRHAGRGTSGARGGR